MEMYYSHDYNGLMWSVEVPWLDDPIEVTVRCEVPLEDDLEPLTIDGPQAAAIRHLEENAQGIYARIRYAVAELLRELREQEQAAIQRATEQGRDEEEERALGLRDDLDEEEDFAEGSYEEPDWWGGDEDRDGDEDEDEAASVDVDGTFALSRAEVSLREKDGVAYLIFHGSCEWDEEHGLCVEYHPDQSPGLGGHGDFR